MLGAAPKAAAEATLMMPRGRFDGSADRRIGANTWQPWIGPHRLMPSTHCQSSRGSSPMGAPPEPTPALLITRVGAAPNHDSDWAASSWTSSNRDTSQAIATASPPLSVIVLTVFAAATSLTSLQTTRPLRRASSVANAVPIPLPAPVTTASAFWLTLFDLRNGPSIPSLPSLPRRSKSALARDKSRRESAPRQSRRLATMYR